MMFVRALAIAAVSCLLCGCTDAGGEPGTPDAGGVPGDAAPALDAADIADGGPRPGDPGDASPGPFDAADVPDGGPPPTPGVIECGHPQYCGPDACAPQPTCDVRTSTCCKQTGDTDAGGTHCLLGTTVDCGGGYHVALHCQAAADCAAGSVCCRDAHGDATCEATCASPLVQFCRTHSECRNGEPCTPQACGGLGDNRIQVCGKQPGCTL